MTFLWAVRVVLGSLLATAIGWVLLGIAFLVVNPNFDKHLSHYFWLTMLWGLVLALVFALSYVWLAQRTRHTPRLPWAIAAVGTVAAALIVPVDIGWPILAALMCPSSSLRSWAVAIRRPIRAAGSPTTCCSASRATR
jgi:hypothetical protein